MCSERAARRRGPDAPAGAPWRVALALAALAALAGCRGGTCLRHSDCDPGLVCSPTGACLAPVDPDGGGGDDASPDGDAGDDGGIDAPIDAIDGDALAIDAAVDAPTDAPTDAPPDARPASAPSPDLPVLPPRLVVQTPTPREAAPR